MKIGITESGDAGLYFQDVLRKLSTVDGAILITKDPRILLNSFHILEPYNIIIHATITGYGGSTIEPNVPPVYETLESYKELVKIFGPERVVLRVDPVIPTPRGIETACGIVAHTQGRLRVSVLDLYKHVIHRFHEECPLLLDKLISVDYGEGVLYKDSIHANDSIRVPLLNTLKALGAEICAEPGVECTGCVSERDLKALGLELKEITKVGVQRHYCRCLDIKTELLDRKEKCPHGCLYCYWR